MDKPFGLSLNYPAMKCLTPSFLRVAFKVGLSLGIFLIVTYLWQGYGKPNARITAENILGMVVLIGLAPVFIWFCFVPRLLAFSEKEITISTLLGKATYPWSSLYCYGRGRGVYKIQFEGDRQPYQIFSGAYRADEWLLLINFMKERFPDRVASGFSIGVGMSPKGK
jgi:hypothetical protein